MIKVLVTFGTRPEAIKMGPLVKELEKHNDIETVVCVTGQHKEMLKQVLDIFKINPRYNLKIMKEKQTLFDINIKILEGMKKILEEENPDIVLVHGDTSTTYSTALAAFYLKIPVGHVEAGLRTYDIYSPFPEEFNRQAVSIISNIDFAPTEMSRNNLLKQGKSFENIFVTGNTAIDALKTTINDDYYHELFDWIGEDKLLLITAHRRENLGLPMHNMFKAIKRILDERDDLKAIYPIHFNPIVRKAAEEVFGNSDKIKIIEPLNVIDFHNFMNKSYIIITDSGGIQEEAPSLGKPVLVMRDTTERPEGIEAGTLKLVGTNIETIYKNLRFLLEDDTEYRRMSNTSNPYGDGFASERIVKALKEISFKKGK